MNRSCTPPKNWTSTQHTRNALKLATIVLHARKSKSSANELLSEILFPAKAPAMITIVNYGMGNLGSMLNMFKRIGVNATIESDPAVIQQAQKLVLPGVGAFDTAMNVYQHRARPAEVLDHKALVEAFLSSVYVWACNYSHALAKRDCCPAWAGFRCHVALPETRGSESAAHGLERGVAEYAKPAYRP
jgi:hypothetical protein